MKTFTNCAVTHVYREANGCADRLTRMGADLTSDYLFLYDPLPWWLIYWIMIKPGMFVIDLLFRSFLVLCIVNQKLNKQPD